MIASLVLTHTGLFSQLNLSRTINIFPNCMFLRNTFPRDGGRKYEMVKWSTSRYHFKYVKLETPVIYKILKCVWRYILTLKRTECLASHKIILWPSLDDLRKTKMLSPVCEHHEFSRLSAGHNSMKPFSHHMLQYADYRCCPNRHTPEESAYCFDHLF